MTEIQTLLYAHQDEKYAQFVAKLIPTLPQERFIGVRTPEYKSIVRELGSSPEIEPFLHTLPHTFYEENILHSILICKIKDFSLCLAELDRFLPYVDNWAVCDGLNPPVFKKHHAELKALIPAWLCSDAVYTKRFGLHTLMAHFLEEDFDPALLDQAAALRSEEYYVNMMLAWLFAEALAKQWDAALPFLEQHRLERWTHNKAIQKAIESYRISAEQKEYLRTLKMK